MTAGALYVAALELERQEQLERYFQRVDNGWKPSESYAEMVREREELRNRRETKELIAAMSSRVWPVL